MCMIIYLYHIRYKASGWERGGGAIGSTDPNLQYFLCLFYLTKHKVKDSCDNHVN